MSPEELIREGKLADAIQALTAELRDRPADTKRRTFLFELLCFSGQYDRAEKHLNVLAQGSPDSELGGLLYRSALAAERKRQALFESHQYPSADMNSKPSLSGRLNGRPFRSIEDLDPRIGARLEIFVAGEYVWLPFEHIGSIQMTAPRFLRDTLWASAAVQAGESFKGREFGEVLIPALAPFTWRHESDDVKLGRATDWKQEGEQLIPFGQKLLIVDDEEIIPILDIRELEFAPPVSTDPSSTQSVGA
jgi:type VI secretion system protein ImpE